MKAAMLGFLAETPVHPGTGRGMGVVDLPVAREAATDYPVIVGSSLKGALRNKNNVGVKTKESERLFGKADQAGDLIVSDGRLLLLPVRSLTSTYCWATCPHLLERYRRDLKRAGLTSKLMLPNIESILDKKSVLAVADGEHLFLEERRFAINGQPPDELVDALKPLMLHEETAQRLHKQLVVLHDDAFAWFARYGLAIQARNVLDEKKKSENLWYEETLPPDTLMYALVASRNGTPTNDLKSIFSDDDPYLQVGGNETVGHGWFAVTVHSADDGDN